MLLNKVSSSSSHMMTFVSHAFSCVCSIGALVGVTLCLVSMCREGTASNIAHVRVMQEQLTTALEFTASSDSNYQVAPPVSFSPGAGIIYTIILLKSVCLSVSVRKLQVAILARSSREMSLTVRIV